MTLENYPLISIIVPCYNYAHFLNFTLKSVLTSSYSNWECIIVDDGSTDNTALVTKEFTDTDKRFHYIYQKNAGLSSARNTGIRNSKGEYIQLLDADDLIAEKKIELQIDYLVKHTEVDIIYGDALFFKTLDEDKILYKYDELKNKYSHLKISGKGKRIINNFCINNFLVVSSPLIKKDIFSRIGLFDTNYFSYEDWHFWFRAAVAEAFFAYCPIVGTETHIRYGHASMLTNKIKLVNYGLKIRFFMMPMLNWKLKIYNMYRIIKLFIKKILLSSKG